MPKINNELEKVLIVLKNSSDKLDNINNNLDDIYKGYSKSLCFVMFLLVIVPLIVIGFLGVLV